MAGCAVVSVFGSGGKSAFFLLWRESFITTGKTKVPVVCPAGCAVVSVLVLAILTKKKKVQVVCLAGCAVGSVFGSGGK